MNKSNCTVSEYHSTLHKWSYLAFNWLKESSGIREVHRYPLAVSREDETVSLYVLNALQFETPVIFYRREKYRG